MKTPKFKKKVDVQAWIERFPNGYDFTFWEPYGYERAIHSFRKDKGTFYSCYHCGNTHSELDSIDEETLARVLWNYRKYMKNGHFEYMY